MKGDIVAPPPKELSCVQILLCLHHTTLMVIVHPVVSQVHLCSLKAHALPDLQLSPW